MSKGWSLKLYLFSYSLSQSGDWLFYIVIPWIIALREPSARDAATTLTILGVMQGVASLFGAASAPVVMNRSAKSHALVYLNLMLGTVSLVTALFYQFESDLAVIMLLVTAKSFLAALYVPVDNSLFAELIPSFGERDIFNRQRQALMHVARVGVYAVAGYLVKLSGATPLLSWDALTFFILALVFGRCVTCSGRVSERQNVLKLWGSGLRCIADDWRWGRILMLHTSLSFLGAINFGLIPILSMKDRNWDVVALGWILAAGGLGGIMASTSWWMRLVLGRSFMLGAILFALSSFCLPMCRSVPQAMFCYFVIVSFNSPIFVRLTNVIQHAKEKEALLSLHSMLSSSLVPILRMFMVYIAMTQLELSTATTMATSAILAIVVLAMFYIPNHRELWALINAQD